VLEAARKERRTPAAPVEASQLEIVVLSRRRVGFLRREAERGPKRGATIRRWHEGTIMLR